MRAKSGPLRRIASLCAENFGAISFSIFCRVGIGVGRGEIRKRSGGRDRGAGPIFSSATIVFSKVGFSVCFAIASASFSSSAIPCSSAGWKCSSLILSKGGNLIRQRAFGEERIAGRGGGHFLGRVWRWRGWLRGLGERNDDASDREEQRGEANARTRVKKNDAEEEMKFCIRLR